MPPRKKSAPAPLRIHGQTVEMVALGDLKTYAKNARLHPEDQLKALEAIIRDSGFTAPLIIDPQNSIIAGHGRALVAKRLGMAQVPCVRVTGLSATQIKALRLSDNQAALRGSWDKDLLLGELTALAGDGFSIDLTAFSGLQLGEIGVPGFSTEERLAEAEETPAPPAKPRVRVGEVWLLGDHRLAIGDSTAKGTVERLLAGAVPHLMVTDPPYGVNYDPKWRSGIAGSFDDPRTLGKVSNDGQADWRGAWELFPGDVAYAWCASLTSDAAIAALESAGLLRRSQIIWRKPHFQIGRGDYHWQHEPCWYVVRKGKSGHYVGDRKQTTVWDIAGLNPLGRGGKRKAENAETDHGTQKPVECMRRPILNNSKPGDFVYDPFCGSGTTLIACEMEGRNCLAIELDPIYAEVIITRWEAFAKKTAYRESDGKALADLRPVRKAA